MLKVINQSFIREATNILGLDALESMEVRFNEFCWLNDLEKNEESWNKFFRPVEYTDFMEHMGQTVVKDDVEYELAHPYYLDHDGKVDKMFGPECASAQGPTRFEREWGGQLELAYPVDSDVKIRIMLKGEGSHNHVHMSYNQVAGLGGGRFPHWTEDHREKFSCTHTRHIDDGDRAWLSDPLYRKTPEGQPTVEDLVRKGSIVQSNYGDTVYIVSSVSKYEYRPKERPEDHIFYTYSLSLIDRKTGKGGFGINELVAVDGKILKLFMGNEDEVFILGTADAVPVAIMEDYESEDEVSCCTVEYDEPVSKPKEIEETKKSEEPLLIKGVQLSLF